MTIVLNGTTGITNDGGYTGDGISFADTTPANTLVTTTSGNVGIGTSSPVSIAGYTIQTLNNGTTGGGVYLQSNGTSIGRILNTATDMYVGGVSGSSKLFLQSGGAVQATIDSSGNLLVGTTTGQTSRIVYQADGTSTNGMTSNMTAASGTRYHIIFRESGTERGSVTSNGSATSYNTSSDYRLKENVEPMQNALGVVAQLKPVTYTWKSDGSTGQGFIAHELQEVVPDCVTGEKDAVDAEGNIKAQGIDTSFLVATLTAAIQEQQAIITDLKSRVEALENK